MFCSPEREFGSLQQAVRVRVAPLSTLLIRGHCCFILSVETSLENIKGGGNDERNRWNIFEMVC